MQSGRWSNRQCKGTPSLIMAAAAAASEMHEEEAHAAGEEVRC